VNAFFAENIRVTPYNVAAMIHSLTSHLPTSEQAVQQQASVTHKDEEPKEILPQRKARHSGKPRTHIVVEVLTVAVVTVLVEFFRQRRGK
jgi:hypothetical protein